MQGRLYSSGWLKATPLASDDRGTTAGRSLTANLPQLTFGRPSRRMQRILVLVVVSIALISVFEMLPRLGVWELPWAELQLAPLLFAFALSMLQRWWTPLAWRLILLAGNGPTLAVSQTRRIYLLTELGRYLPGGLWNYGSRGVWASQAGVAPWLAGTSQVMELAFQLLAAGCLAGIGLSQSSQAWNGLQQALETSVFAPWLKFAIPGASQSDAGQRPVWQCILGAAGVLSLVGLTGYVFYQHCAKRLWRKLKDKLGPLKEGATSRVPWSQLALLQAWCWLLLMHVLSGIAFCCVVLCLREETLGVAGPAPLTCVAIAAAGWLLGVLAPFAPGGLGVREAVICGLLNCYLPLPAAITLAIAWRLVQTLAEFAAVGLLLLISRSSSELRKTEAVA